MIIICLFHFSLKLIIPIGLKLFTSDKTQSLSASSKMRLLFSLLSSKSMTCFSICFIRWMRSSLVGRLGPMRQFLGSSDYLPSISLRLKVSLKLIKNNYISLNLLRSFSVSESIRLPGKGTSLSTAPNSTHSLSWAVI